MQALTQTNDYSLLLKQAHALIEDETDSIANYANLSSLIMAMIQDLNWVGFYLKQDDELVLGPFQGLPACTRISWGKGVCGTAALLNQTQNIPNVHEFEGHIACDSASNSECVIPLHRHQEVIGVLDVDSPHYDRFDSQLQAFLEEIVKLLELKNG